MEAEHFLVKCKDRYYRDKVYCRGEWRMYPGINWHKLAYKCFTSGFVYATALQTVRKKFKEQTK